jgi:putative spermidine/putrescine transport system permease protein
MLLPFLAFFGFFFLWPITTLVRDSFLDNDGAFTSNLYLTLFKEPYASAYATSLQLALISAVVSAIPGALLAYLIEAKGSDRIRKTVSSITGVLANTGGVPLAFMFAGTVGAEGAVTQLLKALGLDLYAGGFNLFSFGGLVLVYCYFQIPLMIIVFSPAVSGIRGEWREAATTLGASARHFWRSVGIPLLFPAFFSALLLLFASAFSAYATARAMFSGGLNLVPLMIGSLVDGNVVNDQTNLGKALAMGMVIVSSFTMIPYLLIQRRVEKWQKR